MHKNFVSFKNAPATFQRANIIILSSFRWHFTLIHPDDIFIFLESFEEGEPHTRMILTLRKEACITLKLKNCSFLTNRIDHSCHVIKHGCLKVANHTTNAISTIHFPKTVTELLEFL